VARREAASQRVGESAEPVAAQLRVSRSDELAGYDGAGARQLAARGSHAKSRQDSAEDDELGKAAGVCFRQYTPEKEQDDVGSGGGPDGAIEVAAFDAFAFGRRTDAGQLTHDSKQQMMAQSGE